MTSHRPAALARLGLDPVTLASRVPRLRLLRIVGSVSAPDVPGHDLTYQAQVGMLDDRMPRTLLADVLASERAYAGVFALLRQPTGSVLDVGLVDSLDSALAPLRHGLTTPDGVLGGAAPRYRLYDTRSGRVAVAALEPHFERALCAQLGVPPGHDLSAVMRERSADEWDAWARAHDLPIVALRHDVDVT
jgi:alpha-methylacyl-CoA racemase